ncbi:hypothetical protein Hanom_Chr05g00396311 [Helianthus anomalus]
MRIDMMRGGLIMCSYQLGFSFLSRLDTFGFQKKMTTGDGDRSTGVFVFSLFFWLLILNNH